MEHYSPAWPELCAGLVDLKEVRGSCACLDTSCTWVFLLERDNDLIEELKHVDQNFATFSVVKSHSEVLVYLAPAHCHRACAVLKDTLVLLAQVFDHLVHDLTIAMAELAVINMKAYSHLLAFNHFVGDARVIWIEREPNVCQTLDELAIVQ